MLQDAFEEFASRVWRDLAATPDEEIRVNATVSVTLRWARPRTVQDLRRLWVHRTQNPMRHTPGIYVVYHNSRPHYVGIAYARSGLRGRWACRMAALRELNLYRALGDQTVHWATATVGIPQGTIWRGRSGEPLHTWRNLTVPEGVLRSIELYLISQLGTRNRGNRQVEALRFERSRRIMITSVNLGTMPQEIQNALGGGNIALVQQNANVF